MNVGNPLCNICMYYDDNCYCSKNSACIDFIENTTRRGIMIEVNNKFEIGEEAYTGVRVPVKYKCPICEGEGKFIYNGYEVRCSNCCGSGKLHNAHYFLLEPVKVKVRRIVASICNDEITVRYKVNCTEANVNNRSETTLFKTFDEAEQYCKECNTKDRVAEF